MTHQTDDLALQRTPERSPKAPLWQKPWVVGAALTLAFIALIAWAVDLTETSITVNCDGIKGGYKCKISPSGDRLVNGEVCWEVHEVCENGAKLVAAKCIRTTLTPKEDITSLIANSEFSNREKCDKPSARAIESVRVESITPKLPPTK